jgi:peptidoglycan/LPS O-acetylase OafA/YrhL
MLPSPTWNSNSAIMPMNIPAWSLLFELFANLIFAIFAVALTTRRMLFICAITAIWLAYISVTRGGLHDGYSWDYPSAGFPRVLFGFFAGVLIQRLATERCVITNWAYLLPFAILLLFTEFGGGVGDAIKVIAVFPVLIIAAASVEPPKVRLFAALGTMSYPFYALHVPLLQDLERVLTVLRIERSALAPWIGLLLGTSLIVISLLADRYYDQPVRRWLSSFIHMSKKSLGTDVVARFKTKSRGEQVLAAAFFNST